MDIKISSGTESNLVTTILCDRSDTTSNSSGSSATTSTSISSSTAPPTSSVPTSSVPISGVPTSSVPTSSAPTRIVPHIRARPRLPPVKLDVGLKPSPFIDYSDVIDSNISSIAIMDYTKGGLTPTVGTEISIPADFFANKKYYPVLTRKLGLIAYIGEEGVYSLKEFGNLQNGRTCTTATPTIRPTHQDPTYSMTKNKVKGTYRHVYMLAGSVLQIPYEDAEKQYPIALDNDHKNLSHKNWIITIRQQVSCEKTQLGAKISVSKVPVYKSSVQERIDAMVNLGENQKMPTTLFEGDAFYPLRETSDSDIVLYVGREGIMSVPQYALKMAGQPYKFLNYIVENNYHVVSTRVGTSTLKYRVNRVLVAAALSVSYSDLDPQKYQVDHIDKASQNDSIYNLHLLTFKDHAAKTSRQNRQNHHKLNQQNVKPVNLVDPSGNILRSFPSLDALCLTYQGYTKIAFKNIIQKKKYIYLSVNGTREKCQLVYGIPPYCGKAKLLEDVTEWFDLRNPETGAVVPGYQISDNLIFRLPTGRLTQGKRKADSRRFAFGLRGKTRCHVDTRWGQASWSGQAVDRNLDMAHNDNNYSNVNRSTLRPTTHADNMADSHGKTVILKFINGSKSDIVYRSRVLAAKENNIGVSRLRNALKYSKSKTLRTGNLLFINKIVIIPKITATSLGSSAMKPTSSNAVSSQSIETPEVPAKSHDVEEDDTENSETEEDEDADEEYLSDSEDNDDENDDIETE